MLVTPECDKWSASSGDREVVERFLDLARDHGWVLSQPGDEPVSRISQRDLHLLFCEQAGVSSVGLERERSALLRAESERWLTQEGAKK